MIKSERKSLRDSLRTLSDERRNEKFKEDFDRALQEAAKLIRDAVEKGLYSFKLYAITKDASGYLLTELERSLIHHFTAKHDLSYCRETESFFWGP